MWPYLERFSYDASLALEEELGEKPDFIIGASSPASTVTVPEGGCKPCLPLKVARSALAHGSPRAGILHVRGQTSS